MKAILSTAIMSLIILTSCHSSNNQGNHEVARQLFMKSMYLTEEYIDSLEQARDSASINRIVENFNLKITTVNYQFPPDTDLDLSEEENDSLIRMFKRIDSTVKKKLKGFAGKEPNDSISSDSTAIDSSKPKLQAPIKPQAVKKEAEVKTSGGGQQATPPSHTDGN